MRREALELICAGRSVADVATTLGLSRQTVSRWQRGCAAQSELSRARARIEQLQNEVAACRRAIELLRDVVPPKGGTR
ncbi:helix-turn-helix domain-containing protein [Streptomyces sp. NPDC048664]|uniref:helix-turn-helix domain-containing protein n=1 Tax=Streptomyces sp. NPDC048664 TaxID=3154505 RepID=UPI00343DD974